MWLLKTFAPWLLLAFLGQQVSLSCGARNKNRGADKTVTTAPGRGQRSGNKTAASGQGKFSIKDKMQCTWRAKDVRDTVRLSVICKDKDGVTDLQCEYNAKPQSCPGYQSNTKGFWKQVARSFKKLQGKVCVDDRALVRISMCKRAPRDAHFKLDSVVTAQTEKPETTKPPPPRSVSTVSTVSTAAPPAGPTACTKRVNHRKTAEANCSGSWASVCNFFLTMLQSDDC